VTALHTTAEIHTFVRLSGVNVCCSFFDYSTTHSNQSVEKPSNTVGPFSSRNDDNNSVVKSQCKHIWKHCCCCCGWIRSTSSELLHTNHTLHIGFWAKVCTEQANKHLKP